MQVTTAGDRFPFWGSPSLRLKGPTPWHSTLPPSLPLLGKPFIEAGTPTTRRWWTRPIASPSGEALH